MGKITEKRFRNNRFQQIDMTNAATSLIISSSDSVSSVLAKVKLCFDFVAETFSLLYHMRIVHIFVYL